MTGCERDPAEGMRQRLQGDLRAALKARTAIEVSVLRCLIAAIDNAGAVPISLAAGSAQTEVERRRLSEDDVAAIVRSEFEVRRNAADMFERLGRVGDAARAAAEMAIVDRYDGVGPA